MERHICHVLKGGRRSQGIRIVESLNVGRRIAIVQVGQQVGRDAQRTCNRSGRGEGWPVAFEIGKEVRVVERVVRQNLESPLCKVFYGVSRIRCRVRGEASLKVVSSIVQIDLYVVG